MIIINIIFTIIIHPLSITLLIIAQTLFICSISGPISYSFWFSYILFLIFLGGILVLFIYITSLASNEIFSLPIKSRLFISSLSITLLFILLFLFNELISPLLYKNDSFNNRTISLNIENSLNQLYNLPNLNLTIITILYLLLTLIIIVKITYIHEGPLRQSN